MTTNKTRQQQFKARMVESGLVQASYWVPKNKKAELDAFVILLKEENANG